MIIDNNAKEKRALEAFYCGNKQLGDQLQDEFLAELHQSMRTEDFCSCKAPCKHHGKCVDCVAIHRGHGHHLPECFRPMVNEKLLPLSQLTEHSIAAEISK